VAECAEGVGSPAYARMLAEYSSPAEFLDAIRTTPVVIDQWQLERLALSGLKHRLLFYTPGAKPEELGCLGAQSFANLEEAVAAVVAGLPSGGRLALIPDGPYAFARAMELEATVA